MVSAPDSEKFGLEPWPGTLRCDLGQGTLPSQLPLSTLVYKWAPANLMLGVSLRWTSIPSRGVQKYSWSLHACVTDRDKLRPVESLRSHADRWYPLRKRYKTCFFFPPEWYDEHPRPFSWKHSPGISME